MFSSKSIDLRRLQSQQSARHEIPAKTSCGAKGELAGETNVKALKMYHGDLAGQVGEPDWARARYDEIGQVMNVLFNEMKKNPLLIGGPGAGKIDVVRGLAQIISRGDVHLLNNVQVIIALDIEHLMRANAFEDGLQAVLKEVQEEARKVILFIDNIHLVLDGDQIQWSVDAADLLVNMIATGQLWCIGGTTLEGHKKHISKHPVFQKKFQEVLIAELGVPETIRILRVLKEKYERLHGVRISDAVLVLAVQLSSRYITVAGQYQPDKAINLVEKACVNAKAERDSQLDRMESIKGKVTELEEEFQSLKKKKAGPLTKVRKELGDLKGDLKHRMIKDKEKLTRAKIRRLKKRIEKLVAASAAEAGSESDLYHRARQALEAVTTIEGIYGSEIEVQVQEIYAIMSKRTGIPVAKLLKTGDNKRLVDLAERLQQRVVGQDEAINDVAEAMLRSRAGVGSLEQPIALLLFGGPDCAGKLELAEALAEDLFADERFLKEIYMPRFSGGVMDLAELVQRNRYGIVFFDGVDETHDQMFSSLFLMLKQGWLKDPDTVLILNCNFDTRVKKITNHFGPQLINTLDQIVIF